MTLSLSFVIFHSVVMLLRLSQITEWILQKLNSVCILYSRLTIWTVQAISFLGLGQFYRTENGGEGGWGGGGVPREMYILTWGIETEKETESERKRQRKRERDREWEKEAEKETESERKRQRVRERDREREP